MSCIHETKLRTVAARTADWATRALRAEARVAELEAQLRTATARPNGVPDPVTPIPPSPGLVGFIAKGRK